MPTFTVWRQDGSEAIGTKVFHTGSARLALFVAKSIVWGWGPGRPPASVMIVDDSSDGVVWSTGDR